MLDLAPRPVAGSLDELLAGCTARAPLAHSDGKSGVPVERVIVDGEALVLKHVHIDDDWTMRFFHETTCIPFEVWRLGFGDLLPERIDHTIRAAAGGLGRDGLGAALLMRDATAELIPEGDQPVPIEHHLQLIDDIAALSAATWGWDGHPSLLPYANRWMAFGDADIAIEAANGFPSPVPRIAQEGWLRFGQRAPARVRDLVLDLRNDLGPLVGALRQTPSSFLHGDWKMGNLGIGHDGRTVLLDWTYCGAGPVCHDLAWYLAINSERLPLTKESSIEALRSSLERHGINTHAWWQQQLGLCLLGMVVVLGWEKALGDGDEMGWWCDRALEGAEHL